MRTIKTIVVISALFILNSCAKDVKDTIDSLECANLISRLDNDNDTCADTIADINKIEKSCGEFLTEESREQIAFIKANCTDN